jgi:putative ABC transport system permease protein
MIRNYLTIALRNFLRHKSFTFINLLGLSIALACAMLTYLFVDEEFNFDSFHTKKDRIFRTVLVENNAKRNANEYQVTHPYPLGPAMNEDLPEIEAFVRLSFPVTKFVKSRDVVNEESFLFADSSLFRVFSFPLLYGNPDQVLTRPNTVAISEQMARKYFGDTNPLGQTLDIRLGDAFEGYEITAVFEEIPSNSTIRSDFFLPMLKETLGKDRNYIKNPEVNLWYVSSYQTIVLLKEKAVVESMDEKLISFRQQYFTDDKEALLDIHGGEGRNFYRTYLLQPIADIHLNTQISTKGIGSNPVYSYMLAAVAICVLLLASVNFMLLSISRSNRRAREVGIRKVMGARKSQLILQFWSEGILTYFLALLLAFLLSGLVLPLFNDLAQKSLSFDQLFSPEGILVMLGITLVSGSLAGTYPSLVMAGLNVLSVFRNKLSLGRKKVVPQMLLSFQFILPIIFLSITLVMILQLRHIRQKDLGFEPELVLVVENTATDQKQAFERFRQAARFQTGVIDISATDAAFTRSSTVFYMRKSEEEEMRMTWAYQVEPNFFDLLDIQFEEGRAFDEQIASDSTEAVIVNQAFVKDWDLQDPIGKKVEKHRIIGVVEDFNFQSLKGEVEPVTFYLPGERTKLKNILVKLSTADIGRTLDNLEQVWASMNTELPFQYSFLDEDMQALYEEDARWMQILQWITGLAILIACMGLIGVMGMTVAGRTKEIGIRKVLGASVSNLLLLLGRDYIKLILIAFLIGIPVANYFISEWLQNFAYRIEIQWWLFAIPGVLIFLIAIFSVGRITWKAAHKNPVDSLRYE